MRIETVDILGVEVARLSQKQVLIWAARAVEERIPRHLVTANAEVISLACREPQFRAVLEKADLVTADGAGVVMAARMLKRPVPERVAGIDLAGSLLKLAEEKGWSVYFLGARAEVVEKAVLNTLSERPRLRIAGYHHGYFSQEETARIVANINKLKPDILLVAMGVPRQELFIRENLEALDVPLSLGVGGSFDVMAHEVERAPGWMQKKSLEWLFRLYKEPRRYKRVLSLPLFVLAVMRQKLLGKR